ncbi:SAM-dependent methyltransferase [Thermopolyspora sp. NPDC052614]|uniref:SAM-dependent methyltransferase n=1 Tax=Thermopolyspora sp. NPDC052614 TaxID=3155682 RepID=UPI0034463D9C
MSKSETGGENSANAVPGGPSPQGTGEQPPPDIDTSTPHVARMYDYFLGGKSNYAADREAAEQIIKVMPQVRNVARVNRRFLIDSVRWLVETAGIRQFIDIGSGLPTQQNVHEVAQSIDKDVRVVYVDNDPLVRVHAEALLATTPNTTVIEGDLRDPRALLERRELREHIDFSQPVALLLVAVLHFIDDTDEAARIASTLYDALPSGSYVVLSHATTAERIKGAQQEAVAVYNRANSGITLRSLAEVARFFEGLTPVGTGLTYLADWSLGDPPSPTRRDDGVVPLDPSTLRDIPGVCGVGRIDR